MKKGILKIKAHSALVQVTGKEKYTCADYNFPDRSLHNAECEFEVEGTKVVKLIINGKEYPKDTAKLEEKAAKEQNKAEQEELERRRAAELEKNKGLIVVFELDSFDLKNRKAICPEDVFGVDVQNYEVDNFNLKFNKFARWNSEQRPDRNPFSFFQTYRGNLEYEIKANFGNLDFAGLTKRSVNQAKQLCGKDRYRVLELAVDWRLIAGLGTASIYETSLCLHHIYGIPYLPASGIKGVLRSWVVRALFGESAAPEEEKNAPLANAEFRALMNKSFCTAFGCPATAKKVEFDRDGNPKKDPKGNYRTQTFDVAVKDKDGKGQARQGALMLWDAFPVSTPQLKTDVMNPHYGQYYGKGEAPVDYDRPIPIPFLTVENTRFRFIIGVRNGQWADWKIKDQTMDLWLKDALENHGLGAKTAVGYGYFQST